MALLKRTPTTWLIRAALAGVTGQAFAHDENNTNQVVTYGPNACTGVTDLPAYQPATCVKHKTELDDGVTETKDSYVAGGPAGTVDAVRQYFVGAFQPHGWTVVEFKQDAEDQEWEYTVVNKVGRQVEVKVAAQEPDEGAGTEFTITEK